METFIPCSIQKFYVLALCAIQNHTFFSNASCHNVSTKRYSVMMNILITSIWAYSVQQIFVYMYIN